MGEAEGPPTAGDTVRHPFRPILAGGWQNPWKQRLFTAADDSRSRVQTCWGGFIEEARSRGAARVKNKCRGPQIRYKKTDFDKFIFFSKYDVFD